MAGKYRNLYYGLNKYAFSILPDSLYHNLLGWIMHRRFGVKYHWMNIQEPKTFSEKLQWLKKHGDIKLKTRLADKYDVREWVAERVGGKYLVELLPVTKNGDYFTTSADDVDFDKLPNEFALKLTKGSGYNVICRSKDELDVEATRSKLRRWLKVNNYYLSREPQYIGKNRIYCERLLEYNITDYKFFCFNGEPEFVELYIDRMGNHRKLFYDKNWQKVEFVTANDKSNGLMVMPDEFQTMKELARKLSKGFLFVRVDLYVHDGNVYFGEMTFHPAGGYTPITPYEWEYRLGEMIKLE